MVNVCSPDGPYKFGSHKKPSGVQKSVEIKMGNGSPELGEKIRRLQLVRFNEVIKEKTYYIG